MKNNKLLDFAPKDERNVDNMMVASTLLSIIFFLTVSGPKSISRPEDTNMELLTTHTKKLPDVKIAKKKVDIKSKDPSINLTYHFKYFN